MFPCTCCFVSPFFWEGKRGVLGCVRTRFSMFSVFPDTFDCHLFCYLINLKTRDSPEQVEWMKCTAPGLAVSPVSLSLCEGACFASPPHPTPHPPEPCVQQMDTPAPLLPCLLHRAKVYFSTCSVLLCWVRESHMYPCFRQNLWSQLLRCVDIMADVTLLIFLVVYIVEYLSAVSNQRHSSWLLSRCHLVLLLVILYKKQAHDKSINIPKK